jgi:ribosomal protein L39E
MPYKAFFRKCTHDFHSISYVTYVQTSKHVASTLSTKASDQTRRSPPWCCAKCSQHTRFRISRRRWNPEQDASHFSRSEDELQCAMNVMGYLLNPFSDQHVHPLVLAQTTSIPLIRVCGKIHVRSVRKCKTPGFSDSPAGMHKFLHNNCVRES